MSLDFGAVRVPSFLCRRCNQLYVSAHFTRCPRCGDPLQDVTEGVRPKGPWDTVIPDKETLPLFPKDEP